MSEPEQSDGMWIVSNIDTGETVAEYAQSWPAHLKQAELGDDYEVRFEPPGKPSRSLETF